MADVQLRSVIRQLRRIVVSRGGLRAPTDAELLEAFLQDKDEGAVEMLVWRHGTMVLNLCRRVLHDEHQAEDAFQAAFLVFVRKAGSIGKCQSVGSWLCKVAYRVAQRLRAQAVKQPEPRAEVEVADQPGRDPADQLIWRDLRSVLDEEIDRLPEKYRAPIVLCYLQGHTTEEAAALLGCPKGTVLSCLSRGREQLRSRLTRRGLVLSAAWLAENLSVNAASAAMPAALVDATVKAATEFAAGKTASGLVSSSAAALTKGVLHTMYVTKLKIAAAVVVSVAALGIGVGSVAQWALAESEQDKASRQAAAKVADVSQAPAKKDSQDPQDVEKLKATLERIRQAYLDANAAELKDSIEQLDKTSPQQDKEVRRLATLEALAEAKKAGDLKELKRLWDAIELQDKEISQRLAQRKFAADKSKSQDPVDQLRKALENLQKAAAHMQEAVEQVQKAAAQLQKSAKGKVEPQDLQNLLDRIRKLEEQLQGKAPQLDQIIRERLLGIQDEKDLKALKSLLEVYSPRALAPLGITEQDLKALKSLLDEKVKDKDRNPRIEALLRKVEEELKNQDKPEIDRIFLQEKKQLQDRIRVLEGKLQGLEQKLIDKDRFPEPQKKDFGKKRILDETPKAEPEKVRFFGDKPYRQALEELLKQGNFNDSERQKLQQEFEQRLNLILELQRAKDFKEVSQQQRALEVYLQRLRDFSRPDQEPQQLIEKRSGKTISR